METRERLEAYADRHAGHGQAVPLEIAGDWLTPRERRRIRHKANSRKTHSHDALLVTLDEDGTPRRQPCPRCSPPKRTQRRVGGTT
jgi:hypothetical protein